MRVGSRRRAPAKHDIRTLNCMLLMTLSEYELIAGGGLRVAYRALMAVNDGRRAALGVMIDTASMV